MKFGHEYVQENDNGCTSAERTPLLANEHHAPTADPEVAEAITSHGHQNGSITADTVPKSSNTQAPDEKPLPAKQILLLCFARLVEPIAFFSIFPFINQMCARNGNLEPADTGFYSGLIESLFSLTQMLVMIFWGRLADRYGRKPTLCISLFGVAFATALFGLAQTLWQMVIFRCIAGIFAGTIVNIRTMITEHSTAKTQARSFSWFAFSGNIGIMVGPLIGGALADPVKQYRGAFEGIWFFEEYPYALATFATGVIALTSAFITLFFVEETLPESLKKGNKKSQGTNPVSPVDEDQYSTTWSLLRAPGVAPVLYLYSHIMILAFSYTAIVPVFWYEPIELGGFSFSSLYISIFMGLTGAAQAIWLLLIFPPLQTRFGTGGVLRACAYTYPFFFMAYPALQALLREGSDAARTAFWIITPVALCLGVGVSMSFTAIQLALNDVSPSPATLGTLNALALTFISGIRAFSPAAFTSLYAVGVRKEILRGYLAWVVMIVLAAGFSLAINWLPPNAEGRVKKSIDSGPDRLEEDVS